jgi:hypothetical protein
VKFLGLILVCVFGLSFIAACVLGISWCTWHLWTFVLGAAWPAGPVNVVHPGFWLFLAAWTLFSLVAGLFRGSKG